MTCFFIITDSGGVQEEAPSLSKPVLVTRNDTERHEAVEMGCVRLVGSKKHNLIKYAQKLIDDRDFYLSMSCDSNPYGDGSASQEIVRVLGDYKFV
jgi:UDP-N-acetylglucosamine 2-epimerase (non-hydrolysing)